MVKHKKANTTLSRESISHALENHLRLINLAQEKNGLFGTIVKLKEFCEFTIIDKEKH